MWGWVLLDRELWILVLKHNGKFRETQVDHRGMFDTNILCFQDIFHVTLLETVLQQPVHSTHSSVLLWRIPKNSWRGFVASETGGRWCISYHLVRAVVGRVGEQGWDIQEMPSSPGAFCWGSEAWFVKHNWKIVSVNADNVDCVIERKVMLCSKSGGC